jgi:CheY-like chemotaxis protein
MLMIDSIRFSQILRNLVGNALKFTEEGEVRVTLAARQLQDEQVELLGMVQDTGVGIAPEKLATIFGTFSQGDDSFARQFGGAGLGLAITRSLLQKMGGGITVESQEGAGSTFKFTLVARPVHQAAPTEIPSSHITPPSRIPSGAKGLKILVVEDNPVNSRFVERLLINQGHSVEVAVNGRLGFEAACQRSFDLILMDVQMPEMDGLEATCAIRQTEKETGQHVPIVALTAHASAEDRDRCLESGMDEYLTKPLQFARLKEILNQIMATGMVQV